MAFQWISEPGMYTILMDRVRPEEQSGASALNFIVVFGAQSAAAGLAGAGYAHYGYPAVIGVAAALAASAAFLFRRVIGRTAAA
jgi:predicted MFS family arabinose efflux permease